MELFTTPITKLDAVNIALSGIGEPRVNEIVGVDALMASDLIDEVSRSVQLKGWHWNREVHNISPDTNGFINLPSNVGKVDSVGNDYYTDVVQRGLRLFNRKTNSYTFTKPVTVELVVVLGFDELNATMKDHVTARASMVLQQRILGSQELDSYLKTKAQETWQELVRDDVEVSDANFINDSWTVGNMVNRGNFGRGVFR